MNDTNHSKRHRFLFPSLLLAVLLLAGCVPTDADRAPSEIRATEQAGDEPQLPELTAVDLAAGQPLRVVASTNIVADVVAQVGGDQITLTSLIPTGADPHSFEPAPQDLIALNDAHVIFINGLALEEPLMPFLTSLDSAAPVVSVNVGAATVTFGDSADHAEHTEEAHDEDSQAHHHDGADPHTWFSIHAVEQWVTNIEQVLRTLDPANADTYRANAAAYQAELAALASELATLVAEVPAAQRKLVTDHDSLRYFAAAYDFEIIGTVIPSLSTVAAPAASEIAALQDQIQAEGVQVVFVGTTVNPVLAQQLAADTGIDLVPIYTGSLSDATGPAPTYLEFMRYNVTTIVNALK